MDTMSNTLLHMRNQLNDCQREINILNEENTRLKNLYPTDGSDISIKTNQINEKMDTESLPLNSTTNGNDQHSP